jgi:NitT/TauT family transport system substrate-binding protein
MRSGYVLTCALLLGTMLAAACQPSGRAPTAAPAPSGAASPAATTAAQSPAADPAAQLPPLPDKLKMVYASVSSNFLPVWLAADGGLFAKNGLDVETMLIVSGTTAMQSLVGGDSQFVSTSAGAPTAAYVNGAPIQFLLGWSPTIPSVFMVDPSITSPEQLKGKSIGITKFGGLPHVAAQLALEAWGLDPDEDVHYMQMGGTPEILAGMQQGAVVGGAYAPPVNIRAKRLGFRVLGDLSQMGIPFQSGALIAMQPYVEANPEVIRRVERALIEAIKVSLTDDQTTRATLMQYSRIDDPEMIDEAIARYRASVQRAPYPSADGIQTVLNLLAEEDPRARDVQPEALINTTTLEQLDRNGYIKRLYGE